MIESELKELKRRKILKLQLIELTKQEVEYLDHKMETIRDKVAASREWEQTGAIN